MLHDTITKVPSEPAAPGQGEPLARRVRLHAILALIEQIAGSVSDIGAPVAQDDTAAAYAAAPAIRRRRFDALAAEADRIAGAGLAALTRHCDATGRDCPAAAEQLADDLREALARLDGVIVSPDRR